MSADYWSDEDMQDPGSWYGGFKDGRVETFGDGERALSHLFTGDWSGGTFSLRISDTSRTLRQRLESRASADRRRWTEILTVRMVDDATRNALGTPYVVFQGPIIDAQPAGLLWFDLTLGEWIGQTLLSDRGMLPWRLIKDGFLHLMDSVADELDRDTPEPIIYGRHIRVAELPGGSPASPASAQGFCVLPTYLGTKTIGATLRHVWLVAGHAVQNVEFLRVDTVITNEGTEWLIPHHAGHQAAFGAPYVDYPSLTYGVDRRYTLVFGKVTDLEASPDTLTDPDACALGYKQLTVSLYGTEDVGDGTGELITDRFQAYKHFLINYVANHGPESYQSGNYLDNPTRDTYEGPVLLVDEDSFDACTAIGQERLPAPSSGSPLEVGYLVAAIIGARSSDRAPIPKWIADFNRSGSCRFCETRLGQMRIVMLHPTDAIKAAALLYTDATEVLKGSFQTAVQWDQWSGRVPFRADFNHATGVWMTTGSASADQALSDYNREQLGDVRDYPFAPGITAAFHLARLEALITQDPPRTVVLEVTVGPDGVGDSAAYLENGDYFRYRHFDAVSGTADEIRLGQVVRMQVQAGKRKVLIEGLDCEDLIDYDAPQIQTGGSPAEANETCATAVDVGDLSSFSFTETYDTTNNAEDDSVHASPPLFPGAGFAYHAKWFKVTPFTDGLLHIDTFGSAYNTQICLWIGTCGSLTLVAYNDDFGFGTTSLVEYDATGGIDLFALVAGVGPEDAGFLQVAFAFTPTPP